MFKIGDKVIFKNDEYYIIGGPTMGTEGAIYQLSKTPPPLRALESEITKA